MRQYLAAVKHVRGVNQTVIAGELPVVGWRLAFLADTWGNLIELVQVLA